jgi:hydrogenase maturation protein HypF
MAQETGLNKVALSGGCFQNRLLLTKTQKGLEEEGLEVLTHHQVPCNDGGVSLGQAIVANCRVEAAEEGASW